MAHRHHLNGQQAVFRVQKQGLEYFSIPVPQVLHDETRGFLRRGDRRAPSLTAGSEPAAQLQRRLHFRRLHFADPPHRGQLFHFRLQEIPQRPERLQQPLCEDEGRFPRSPSEG